MRVLTLITLGALKTHLMSGFKVSYMTLSPRKQSRAGCAPCTTVYLGQAACVMASSITGLPQGTRPRGDCCFRTLLEAMQE